MPTSSPEKAAPPGPAPKPAASATASVSKEKEEGGGGEGGEETLEEEGLAVGDEEDLDDGELVEMVPCALLEDGELVELPGAPGEASYIALDGAVPDDGTGVGQGLIYYATPYGTDIEGLEAFAQAGGAPRAGVHKGFLDGMAANSSGLPADRLEAGATGSRAETPEVKTQKEKTIARVVMAVACTLFTLCVVLVGVTLSMSDHITSMVRQMHFSAKTDPTGDATAPDANVTAFFSSRDRSRL